MVPYEAIEPQFKELTALVDEPLALIGEFISGVDDQEKQKRHEEVHQYFLSIAGGLGELKDTVFESPEFYDNKWDNKNLSL